MAAGFLTLHCVAPDFGGLAKRTHALEATFRKAHHYLKQHAESIAFFGGASREGAAVDAHLGRFLTQERALARARWLHSVVDEFFSKQLPHNVTWAMTLLYALQRGESGWVDAAAQVPPRRHSPKRLPVEEKYGTSGVVFVITSRDFSRGVAVQGKTVFAMRYLATVVANCFTAFGDILQLQSRLFELSGGVARVSELLDAAHAADALQQSVVAGNVSPEGIVGALLHHIVLESRLVQRTTPQCSSALRVRAASHAQLCKLTPAAEGPAAAAAQATPRRCCASTASPW